MKHYKKKIILEDGHLQTGARYFVCILGSVIIFM